MKYLHIMSPNMRYTYRFIKAMHIHLEETMQEHSFLIMETINYIILKIPQLLEFPELLYLPSVGKEKQNLRMQRKMLNTLLNEASYVVWHTGNKLSGIISNNAQLKKQIKKKSIWCITGDFQPLTEAERKRFAVRDCIQKNSPFICTTYPCELSNGMIPPFIPYPFPSDLRRVIEDTRGTGNPVEDCKIWVGHNSSRYNAHKQLLSRLQVLSDHDNIRILLPMNYSLKYEWGRTEKWQYRESVASYARRMFGMNHVTVMRYGEVPPQQYYHLLNSTSAAIFNKSFPFLIEDIFAFLMFKKKVFFQDLHSSLVRFLQSNDVIVYSLDQLGGFDIEELKEPVYEQNTSVIEKYMDEKTVMHIWKDFFDHISGSGRK